MKHVASLWRLPIYQPKDAGAKTTILLIWAVGRLTEYLPTLRGGIQTLSVTLAKTLTVADSPKKLNALLRGAYAIGVPRSQPWLAECT